MRLLAQIAITSIIAAAAGKPSIPISALAFHPAGKYLAVGGYQEILIWDADTSKLDHTITGLPGQVRALAFHKDGKILAVAAGVPAISGVVKLIDFETGKELATLDQQKDEILTLAFSPDGAFIAAGGVDAHARVWNVAGRKELASLIDHSDWVTGVAFSPNGKLMATSSADKTVQIYDTATWKSLVQLPLTVTEAVNALVFSADNETLAFAVGGLEERAIRVYRTESVMPGPEETDRAKIARKQANMKTTRPYAVNGSTPLALVWAEKPKPRMYVACNDKSIKVVAATGGVTQSLFGHTDWVYSVAISPDGSKLASGSADGSVLLWSTATGRQLAKFDQPAPAQFAKDKP